MSSYNNFNEIDSKFQEQECSKQDVDKSKFSLFNQTKIIF